MQFIPNRIVSVSTRRVTQSNIKGLLWPVRLEAVQKIRTKSVYPYTYFPAPAQAKWIDGLPHIKLQHEFII